MLVFVLLLWLSFLFWPVEKNFILLKYWQHTEMFVIDVDRKNHICCCQNRRKKILWENTSWWNYRQIANSRFNHRFNRALRRVPLSVFTKRLQWQEVGTLFYAVLSLQLLIFVTHRVAYEFLGVPPITERYLYTEICILNSITSGVVTHIVTWQRTFILSSVQPSKEVSTLLLLP